MGALITDWLASHWLLIAAVAVVLAALANPVLVWKLKAWILLAIVLWWGWTGHAAYDHLAAQVATKEAKAAAEVAAATTRASEAARSEEQTRVEVMDMLARAYERGKTDGKAAADHVLAGVADGTYVLRDKFRCPAPGGAGAPAASAGGGDGAQGAVLSDADVQFLVRFAAEADDAVRQLAAAQAVIAADREQP